VNVGFDVFEYLHNHPVWTDQKRGAVDAIMRFTVAGLRSPYTVGLAHISIFVSQERKRQVEFTDKRGMAFRGIGADAQNDHTSILIFTVIVSEVARLDCAAGSIIFGVEIKHHRFAT